MEASNSGADECLLQDTEINKQKLMDAIRNEDVKTAKQLIEEGININFILDRSTPLHAALKLKSMDMLELLLSQPNIDLNISNEELYAPLVWSLESDSPYGLTARVRDEFVLRLIRAGCNINMSNCLEEPLLHLSIHYGTTTITNELLKRGADVNTFCSECGPALHNAVESDDLELVCMLMYYNADVYIKWRGHTAFSYALYFSRFEIVEVLENFYDFSHDDDVNYIFNSKVYGRIFERSSAEQFKAVWPKFDSEITLSLNPTFIDLYLNCWCISYSTSEWIECLYLILNSDIALDLIECYRLSTGYSFLQKLLSCICDRHVQSKDCIGLIYMVLQLGLEVTIDDINFVAVYGLNQDLEPFIYCTYTNSITDRPKFVCPLHAFVIGMQTDYSVTKIAQLFHDALEEWKEWCCKCCTRNDLVLLLSETFAKMVKNFSFPADVKNSIENHWDCVVMDGEWLQEVPKLPSLIELSRNQIHKYLVQKFRFKQPYQLQDVVKKLLIPNGIKDIILFKAPIY